MTRCVSQLQFAALLTCEVLLHKINSGSDMLLFSPSQIEETQRAKLISL